MTGATRTAYVTHPRFTEHDMPEHPEHAGRIRAIWRRLNEAGLTERLHQIEAQPASLDSIRAVHTKDYLALLDRLSSLDEMVRLDADTYAGPTSYEIAQLAAGGVVQAVEEVVRGRSKNALAVIRPPGHHAIPERGMGFCLLSNIAIAARYANQHLGVERVFIVDYDVHHGNGTEAVFYDDPAVYFISTHQSGIYPLSGHLDETGTGAGRGFTMNIPLVAGHGDASYKAIFEDVIWKAAERYQPQLILVSAGFDAHWADPLARIRLSLDGFARISREMVNMAEKLCGGKIAFVMEGGYNLDALSYGWANIARILLGDVDTVDPLGAPDTHAPEPDILPVLEQVKRIHRL